MVSYEIPFAFNSLSKEDQEVYNKYYNLPLLKLFEEFEKTIDGEMVKDRLKYDCIRYIIADKLGLLHRDTFGSVFAIELDELDAKVKDIDSKFKAHRHDTSKVYTTKPEW